MQKINEKLYRQFRKLKFATLPLLKNIMNHLSSLILIFIFISAILLSPTSYMKSGKVARIFFCHFKNVGTRHPDNFFYFHLPLCHFATFSGSLLFIISAILYPRHFYNLPLCHFATFHFFNYYSLLLIFPHFHIFISLYIYFFNQNI